MIRLGVNGYGRIGRNIVRAVYEAGLNDEFRICAVNDLGDVSSLVHLTAFDSAHGRFSGTVEVRDGNMMVINGEPIRVLAERDPAALPWGELNVDVVLECTGLFTSRAAAAAHLEGGARRVLISAPSGPDVDFMVVYGVNHEDLRPEHQVVSNASCTTNCLAPIAKVLHQGVGVEHGVMTTVHAVTNDQVVTDSLHSDARRARSALQNMVPTKTGAAAAVGRVLPELDGRLDGYAVRVPTVNVSMVDFTFRSERATDREELDGLLRAAAEGELQSILYYSDEPLVSTDFNHHPGSTIYDAGLTRVLQGRLVKVVAWYDNEWGFSNRMLDVARVLGGLDRDASPMEGAAMEGAEGTAL